MDFADVASDLLLESSSAIGIPLALLGAVFLSLGTQYQHRGVGKVGAIHGQVESGLGGKHLLALLKRPSWVVGTIMLGLAIVLQLASLWFAPLIVVQPLGAVALVITAILNSRLAHVPLDRRTIRAIIICVLGVGAFVTVAALVAVQKRVSESELTIVIVLLAGVAAVWGVLYALFRRKAGPVFYIVAAGMLFGFVATLAKVVIGRIQTLIQMIERSAVTGEAWTFGPAEWLTMLCVVGLVAASVFGSYFVQSAHANGPPDLVVAGLTVVDPIVAVAIGIVVLGEAAGAPPWAIIAFIITGGVAVFGVFQLAKHHPQMSVEYRETGELPFTRGPKRPRRER